MRFLSIFPHELKQQFKIANITTPTPHFNVSY